MNNKEPEKKFDLQDQGWTLGADKGLQVPGSDPRVSRKGREGYISAQEELDAKEQSDRKKRNIGGRAFGPKWKK